MNKKAVLSQRWQRDAPICRPKLFHPNFVHAYVHYFVQIWFWT